MTSIIVNKKDQINYEEEKDICST